MDPGTIELIGRAQKGEDAACEELILNNAGLIWSIARRYFGCGVDPDDLYQLGCVGFIKAVQGFDVSFGTQFSTYAVPKIAGEIRRFLRDDGSIKVSRGVKERAVQIRRARAALEQQLGREPTLTELAVETGITVEDIAVTEIASSQPDSLQRQTGEDSFTLESVISSGNQEERMLDHLSLQEAMERLPEREQMILRLRYYRGMTQDACARILGVSQVQVSRLERRAFTFLRTILE